MQNSSHLNDGEEMDTPDTDMPQVDVIRLVFHGYQHEQQTINHLNAVQSTDAHVQEDAVKNRHGNKL